MKNKLSIKQIILLFIIIVSLLGIVNPVTVHREGCPCG